MNIDVDSLVKAEEIVLKLANGCNPLTGEKLQDSILEDARVIRCVFLVKDVLKQAIENDGYIGNKPRRTQARAITAESLAKYNIVDRDISLSTFLQGINAINPYMKKISFGAVSDMLYKKGILVDSQYKGSKRRVASDDAAQYGIFNEIKWSPRGEYYAVLYNARGQQYLLDNLADAIY